MPTTLEPVPAAPAGSRGRSAAEAVREAFARHPGRAAEPPALRAFREAGLREFLRTGYPTVQAEDWRFTPLAPLLEVPFHPASAPPPAREIAAQLARLPFLAEAGLMAVFVDGHLVPELSRGLPTAGGDGQVTCTDLRSALAHDPEQGSGGSEPLAPVGDHAFTALNRAFFTDGLHLRIPPGQTLTGPVCLVHWASGRPEAPASLVRHRVHVGAGARATVIELSAGPHGARYVANHLTELIAGDGAEVEWLKFQDQPATAFEISGLYVRTGRAVKLHAHSFALGARLSRHHIRLGLRGEDSEAVLNGLYLVHDERLADHHMIVEHASPRCASHEYFNGILTDRARGVFHGRILVRPGAQKTDAKQTNKNLLLSDDAVVDTKPQLEIYADDVKCTHGATVGQLHPEHIFYLRARGIPHQRARQMLIHAFAGEIIDRVQCAAAREVLDRLIWDRLEAEERLGLGARD